MTDTDVKVDLALNLEFEANIPQGIRHRAGQGKGSNREHDRHEGVRSECPRGRHRAGIGLDKVRRMSQEASFLIVQEINMGGKDEEKRIKRAYFPASVPCGI